MKKVAKNSTLSVLFLTILTPSTYYAMYGNLQPRVDALAKKRALEKKLKDLKDFERNKELEEVYRLQALRAQDKYSQDLYQQYEKNHQKITMDTVGEYFPVGFDDELIHIEEHCTPKKVVHQKIIDSQPLYLESDTIKNNNVEETAPIALGNIPPFFFVFLKKRETSESPLALALAGKESPFKPCDKSDSDKVEFSPEITDYEFSKDDDLLFSMDK